MQKQDREHKFPGVWQSAVLLWASSLGNEVATGCHRRPPNDILHTLQWLEWVPESRVLKPVAVNLQQQAEFQTDSQEAAVEGLPWPEAWYDAADRS